MNITTRLDYDSFSKINWPSILQFIKSDYRYDYNAIIFKYSFNKLFIKCFEYIFESTIIWILFVAFKI